MSVETTAFADRFSEWTPLARGAEGRLYRVRDRWTQRLGALKVGSGESARDALVGEFRLLSFLRHPCLVRSEDLLVEADTWAHLLQYVPAVEPARIWDEGGEDAVRAALTQALRGLTYLHRRGFVHGDVAPGNVLVWRDGDRWRAKLADLGLTLPLEKAAVAGIRGTPGYWAPESARGEGLTPQSDLYALAATAFAWIEGRGPWDGLGSADMLRTIAAGPPVPRPRRRISPELESLLTTLGSPHPERRSRWDWAELRRHEALWGPPTVTATVVGVEPYLQEWGGWAKNLPEGGVGSLLLRGRVGTGRTTATRCFGRSLAAEGWTGIWQPPRWWGSESNPKVAESQDPVLLSRELVRVLADRDAVLVWPTHATDAQLRVLRGFLAAREDATSTARTVVLKVASIEAEDEEADWLLGATRCRLEHWTSPDPEAIDSMRADLFPPEEGLAPASGFRSDSTPLALVLHKQAFISGAAESPEGAGEKALEQELARLWERASPPAREALAVLAWSDRGWAVEDLASVLGWEVKIEGAVLVELDRLRLTRRRFEQETAVNSLTDEMTRGVLEQRAQEVLSPSVLTRLALSLEEGTLHGGDLRLARRMVRAGQEVSGFLVRSLDAALTEGRYEEILELADTSYSRDVDRRCLLAAQRAGKYEDEVRILRRLIDCSEAGAALEEQKMLAQALANLGDWQGALDVCRSIEEDPKLSASHRIWAGLQRAETLWQAGRFAEADAAYESVQPALTGAMQDEWLRFAVGRARQHGQRGDMAGVKRYLEKAEETVGKARCERDPMYLNTLGGMLMQNTGYDSAYPILHLGQRRAREESNWQAYVMVSGRVSSVEFGLGNVWDALKTARDSLSVSLATGNRRSSSMISSFLGHYELHSANIGSALRGATVVISGARKVGDENLELQGLRLLATVSAAAGLDHELKETSRSIQSLGSRIGEGESSSYAYLCEGRFWLGAYQYGNAIDSLEAALSHTRRLGQFDNELHARLLLCVAQGRCGLLKNLELELAPVEEALKSGRYPLLNPLLVLAKAEVSRSTVGSDQVGQMIQRLWDSGRLMEILDWLPFIHQKMSESLQNDAKKKVVRIVKRASDSFDDALTRNRFLSYPKVVGNLRFARS